MAGNSLKVQLKQAIGSLDFLEDRVILPVLLGQRQELRVSKQEQHDGEDAPAHKEADLQGLPL
jgi:hypothetical protein